MFLIISEIYLFLFRTHVKYATDRYLSWTLDNQINYNKTFGKHNLGVTLLQSASKYNKESGSESANAIPKDRKSVV